MASSGATAFPLEGGCDCGKVRYALETAPIAVHCCHCRWCQRETGASFALNAMIETGRLRMLKSEPEWTTLPSHSGRGQSIGRCPECGIAMFSVYLDNPAQIQRGLRTVRVGTLDQPNSLPPDVHIWTAEKQPWIILSGHTPAFPDGDYDREKVWSQEGLERRRRVEESTAE